MSAKYFKELTEDSEMKIVKAKDQELNIKNNAIYISDLSFTIRRQLCDYLEGSNVWEQLAQAMGFTNKDIQDIKRRQKSRSVSPGMEILRIWGDQYNHTTTELFVLLHRLKLYDGMRVIKSYVSRQQHLRMPQSKVLTVNPRRNNIENVIDSIKQLRLDNQVQNNLLNSTDVKDFASRILEINYDELTVATQNWHENCILGKGGFGIVYRGYWKHTEVAIKQIHYSGGEAADNIKIQIHQGLNELKYLNSCRHDNVLPLYGYSIRGEKPCLVYQLMKGGSLEQRLNSKKLYPLTWQQRISICLGTARGINYLHTFRDKPLIHGDIKPANVLLDQCLQPKIGDFGLASQGPNHINSEIEVTRVFGTKPYLPPEFLNSKKLSTKVDIYSFGVVLLETFTGLRVYDCKRQHHLLANHITHELENGKCKLNDLIDKRIATMRPAEDEVCKRSIQLALLCIADNPIERPEMEQILDIINSYYNFTLISP